MGQTITAIYEHGVLRPLKPLKLRERARVEILVVSESPSRTEEREELRCILLEAGIIKPHPSVPLRVAADEARLATARKEMGATGPLSELIIADRLNKVAAAEGLNVDNPNAHP